jgi:hypothetical protein
MNNQKTIDQKTFSPLVSTADMLQTPVRVVPQPARSLREEISYRVRYFVNAYPLLYMPTARIRHRDSNDRIVRDNTDLVIEAFGRTGTTFANFAFLAAQRRRVRTVHHTHAAAQVITAAKMDIPTLVIIRQPEQVALSHMARHRVSARPTLVAWIRFHSRLLPFRNRIVFCSFDQMTLNFTPVIELLNQKFNAGFDVWQHTKENEAEIFDQIKSRNRGRFRADQEEQRKQAFALPTAEREALKQQLRHHLQADSLTDLRDHANRLYTLLIQSPD